MIIPLLYVGFDSHEIQNLLYCMRSLFGDNFNLVV